MSGAADDLPGVRGWLSSMQFAAIVFLAMFPTIILLLPGDLLRIGGRYGWWTPLVAAPPAVLVCWLAGRLGARLGDLVRSALGSMGPVVGRALLFVLWAGVGTYVVVIVREITDTSSTTFVKASVPLTVLTAAGILSAGILSAGILSWLGPVVIGRMATVIAVILTFVYLGVLVGTLPSMHAIWALPVLPRNHRFLAWPALLRTWVWLAEPVFISTVLMNHVDAADRKVAGRTLVVVVVVVAVLTATGTWVMVADAGPRGAAEFTLPFLELANGIAFGPFVQHLETFIFPIESMGGIVKLGIFLWVWARLGEGLVGGGLKAALIVQGLAAAWLSLALFANLAAVDKAVYIVAWSALPVLVAGTFLVYAAAGVQRGRDRI